MPRYFFHSQNGHIFHDDEGSELPDDQAAKAAMLNILSDRIRNNVRFWETADLEITASNADGLVLFKLQLFGSESLAVRGRRPDQFRPEL